jgi:hypothetical protein
MKTLYVAILGFAFMVTAIYCINVTISRNALNTELTTMRRDLTSTQSNLASVKQTLETTKQSLSSATLDLTSTKQALSSNQVELTSMKQTLSSTQAELTSTKQTLNSTQQELTSTKQTLNSVQQASVNLQNTLSTTQQQLKVAQDTLGGLGITLSTSAKCYDVKLVDNPAATNPTWSQLMAFISQDQTQNHEYISDVYDCSQFSRDLHNNAEAAGIRVAEVQIWFSNDIMGHALNAFLTTDYGLVYVDCVEQDTIAHVKVGKAYRAVDTYAIRAANVQNDLWWDSLRTYYYIPTSFFTFLDIECVTSSISVFW